MARPQSPLVGYNTNVRHRGKLYHIQTEDSGINHPHVITHLFADGGRIIASRKTSYAEYVGAEDLPNIVRKLMQQQHKGIFIELRDCVFDEDDGAPSDLPNEEGKVPAASAPEADIDSGASEFPAEASRDSIPPSPQIQAFERAAAQKSAEAAAMRGVGRYKPHVPAHGTADGQAAANAASESIFGGGLLKGKSLDEVILSYLADDLSDTER